MSLRKVIVAIAIPLSMLAAFCRARSTDECAASDQHSAAVSDTISCLTNARDTRDGCANFDRRAVGELHPAGIETLLERHG